LQQHLNDVVCGSGLEISNPLTVLKRGIRLSRSLQLKLSRFNVNILLEQESPADADKPARLRRMQKLLQFDVFRFISPNSISPNFKLPMHSFTRYV